MKYEYVLERARDEKQMLENSCLGETEEDTEPDLLNDEAPEVYP